MLNDFGLSNDWNQVASKPWSLLTYGLVHINLWHFVGNLILFKFSIELAERYFQPKYIERLFFGGVIMGGIFFLMLSDGQSSTRLLGLSAGNMSILFLLFLHYPNLELSLIGGIQIKLKWLIIALIVFQLFSILDQSSISWKAHIGGAITALIGSYTVFNNKPKRFMNIFDWFKNLFRRKSRLKVVHKGTPRDDHEYNSQKVAEQEELNRILDKINSKGYEKLSKEERAFLFKMKKN